MAKSFKKILAIIMALTLTMAAGVNAYAIDLTGGSDNSGENWVWNEEGKTLTLDGTVNEGFTLVNGSNVYVVNDSTINGGDSSITENWWGQNC